MKQAADKKETLVGAADLLFHKRGYKKTTLADIAAESGVPLGAVYYYFKTKDDLMAAVIETRIERFENRRAMWERASSPAERLGSFIDYAIRSKSVLARHGCPNGSLCQELDKERSAISEKSDGVIKKHIEWVSGQMRLMGKKGKEPKALATHFIAALQGAILVAHALNEPGVVEREAKTLRQWIKDL